MSNKAILVVSGIPNPENQDSMQKYMQAVSPILSAAGGKLIKRVKMNKTLLGNPTAMMMVMEFEDTATIESIFISDEYKAIIKHRNKGFKEINIHIAEEM